jgi:hypothetical protein
MVDLMVKSATEFKLCSNGIRQTFVANFKLVVYTRKMNNCNVARKFRVGGGGGKLIKKNYTPTKIFQWA